MSLNCNAYIRYMRSLHTVERRISLKCPASGVACNYHNIIMPPKRTSKTETINASKRSKNVGNTDQPPCAIKDVTEHDSKTSGDATEETKLTSPFDACRFLQKQTMAAASRKNATPLFFLNTASVATAAKHAQPLVTNVASIPAKSTMPDVVAVPAKITMPDVAASASLSTLSKQFDTLHHGIQLTQSMVVHHTATPTAAVPSLPQYNLSMTAFTDSTLRSIVKTCIKDHIFRKCKFLIALNITRTTPIPSQCVGK